MAKTKVDKTYAVKVRVSIPGFRNKFFSGIAIALNPEQASMLAADMTFKAIARADEYSIKPEHVKAIKCDKIKEDFFLNHHNYKPTIDE